MSSNVSTSRSDTELENFQNFENLPFHLDLPQNIFHIPDIHTAFLQITLRHHPLIHDNHQVQTIQLSPQQYRDNTSTSSDSRTSSTSTSAALTVSSLPPLVPSTDMSDQLVTSFSTLDLEEPPLYTPSIEAAPDYESADTNSLILRRIRALEGETAYIIRQIRELRDSSIRQLTTDIEVQIEEHLS